MTNGEPVRGLLTAGCSTGRGIAWLCRAERHSVSNEATVFLYLPLGTDICQTCRAHAPASSFKLVFLMSHPTFAHPVFEQLYARDYFIDDAVLREILALGPAAAGPELLKIIDAALNRFQANEPFGDTWLDDYYFHHALYLLHELHAPEALDVYYRLLRLDANATEFWFGDNLFEEVPALLAHAAHARLPELLLMLEDKEMLLQHRQVASSAIAWLAREQPVLRPAIGEYVQNHLRRIIAQADQVAQLLPTDADDIYGPDTYLGMLLADMQEAGLRELEPEMRELHRLGLVDESFAGGPDGISFAEPGPLLPVPDIFARYQQLRAEPDNYSVFHPDAAAIAKRRAEQEARYAQIRRNALAPQPRQVLPKIGRNDPCPCGSGQKYKKCHGA